MKAILSIIISAAFAVSGYAQTRNVLVGTNNAVVQPTNFWSADASNARTGLGLGTSATNPATAFQPSSSTLSNLSSNNGLGITNLQASNLVGVIPSSNISSTTLTNISGTLSIASGGTGATNASNARVNLGATAVGDALFISTNASAARTAIGASSVGSSIFTAVDAAAVRSSLSLGTASTNPSSSFQASSLALSNLALSNGGALTNLQATSIVGVIPSSNIPSVTFSNLSGTLPIAQGGTSATNAANARQNLGSTVVGDAVFIATNAAAARTAMAALATNGSAAGLTNFPTVPLASNVTGTIAISNGGTGSTTAGGARTNLGLGATNNVSFLSVTASEVRELGQGIRVIDFENLGLTFGTNYILEWSTNGIQVNRPLVFFGTNVANESRTNLGLGATWLTNTTASGFQAALFGTNTNPVLVNTNGEVVSPTNFWQVAPISTIVQYQTNVTGTSTNAATNSRNLFLFSLTPSVSGVTNTVTLPTNPATTFEGDRATIIHLATNSANTVTAIRQLGAATNLITLNQADEAVLLMYRSGSWGLSDNISYVEPIYFSGTNAAVNAAASRTNLGLGASNSVEFNQITIDNNAFIGGDLTANNALNIGTNGAIYFVAAGQTRTNLGLPLAALTNTDVANFLTAIGLGETNQAAFREVYADTIVATTSINNSGTLTNVGNIVISQSVATNGLLFIRRTNNEPFLGLANLIASNNVTVSNETLFRVGVSEATNKAAQFGFRSTNTNGNGVAVFSVFGFNALMMIGPSDPAAGTNPIEATVYSVSPNNKVMTLIRTNTGATMFHRPIEFENTTNQAVTRTNLGLGQTNDVTFSNITASGTLTATSTVTAKTNLVVEGFVDFTTNRAATNGPTNAGNFNTHAVWITIKAGTNTYFLPAYK